MTEQDDPEFTDGLRSLLSDDRFALRPTASARETIVACARRRRRRREVGYATGGSLAVAVVLIGGFLLAGPGLPGGDETSLAENVPAQSRTADADTESDSQPATRGAPMATGGPGDSGVERDQLEAVPEERAARPMRVGPTGYRALRLGMSYDEIRQTGMLADPGAPPPEGCMRYRLAEGGTAVRDILVSERAGLAVVTANQASTPEGVAVGSTREQVERTYTANRADDAEGYRVTTGAGGYYRLTLDGDRVTGVLLVADEQDCGRY